MREQVFGVDGDRTNVSNVAIIITDGKPTDPSTVQAAIDAVHNRGIKTLAVGVTDQVDEATLKQLSSPPSQVTLSCIYSVPAASFNMFYSYPKTVRSKSDASFNCLR